MTFVIERRRFPRYPAVENVALVQFQRRKRTRTVGACLVNINATGALLRMRKRPMIDGVFWVRLGYPVATPWLIATAVRIGKEGVGIAFVRGWDRTFFGIANRGLDFRSAPRAMNGGGGGQHGARSCRLS